MIRSFSMNIELSAGTILGNRYRISERIGRGGMAEVFRGIDHVLERDVAIKVLTERSDDVCRRFLIEAQSMARLNHPNIVAVYDVGVDRHLSYIILEFVQGTTMREIDKTNLSFDNAIALTIQLLEALRYAHSQGIIHRDLKPGNLMVGQDQVLKVTDFGLARRMSDMSNLTQSGEIVGTIAYLPPERFLGKPGDRSSDLYSVGVLMYELLCGALPFPPDSGDLVAVMYAHVNDRPKPPRLLNPHIPPALDRIIMRLLEKEPSRRYADASTLIADLRALQATLGRTAPKSSQEMRADKAVAEAVADLPIVNPKSEPEELTPTSPEPSTGGYLKSDLVTSKTFTAALSRVMQGMMCARKQQWREAEDHYAAAVGMLTPLRHPSELARTYARLGGMYCAKMKATGIILPSEVSAAREYLTKALPILREKHLTADVKEAEANLRSLESLKSTA
jgi:serine/threonine protein kinase